MAYKEKIESMIKREPWRKRDIQDNFYDELLTYKSDLHDMSNVENELIFYLNDVVRYNIFFGSNRMKDIITKVLDIQATANELWNWNVNYADDLLGERFSVQGDNELTKSYFVEQERIIDLYYKHY